METAWVQDTGFLLPGVWGIIDCGATKTMGGVSEVEKLQLEMLKQGGNQTLEVDVQVRQRWTTSGSIASDVADQLGGRNVGSLRPFSSPTSKQALEVSIDFGRDVIYGSDILAKVLESLDSDYSADILR